MGRLNKNGVLVVVGDRRKSAFFVPASKACCRTTFTAKLQTVVLVGAVRKYL